MAILLILLVLALIFGVGAVLEGILWVLLISLVLVLAAGWWGYSRVRGLGRGR